MPGADMPSAASATLLLLLLLLLPPRLLLRLLSLLVLLLLLLPLQLPLFRVIADGSGGRTLSLLPIVGTDIHIASLVFHAGAAAAAYGTANAPAGTNRIPDVLAISELRSRWSQHNQQWPCQFFCMKKDSHINALRIQLSYQRRHRAIAASKNYAGK